MKIYHYFRTQTPEAGLLEPLEFVCIVAVSADGTQLSTAVKTGETRMVVAQRITGLGSIELIKYNQYLC